MVLNLDERPINQGASESGALEPQNVEKSRHTGLWFAFGLLVCVMVAAGAHGYRVLRTTGIEVAQLPAMVKSIADVSGRLQAVEQVITSWAGEKQKLADRLNSVERKFNSGLQQARKHTDKATEQLEARIEDELDERGAVVEERLSKVEVAQSANRAQFDQLRAELTSARQEIAALRQSSDSQFASLNQRAEGSDRNVATLEHRLDRRKVDFEVAKNRESELTPGVALKVTATNVSHQQFSGWIQLVPEGRFLWVNEHGIQQPVAFFRQPDVSQFDLVVTRVAGDSVVGFLLMPAANTEVGGPVPRLETSVAHSEQGR